MKIFDKDYAVSILTETTINDAARLAVMDLQSNLRKLSGKSSGFDIKNSCDGCGILIQEATQGEPESYTVTVEAELVRITGADTLGNI